MSDTKVTIALDAMGGDNGPGVVLSAALIMLQKNSFLRIILVGNPDVLEPMLQTHRHTYGERLQMVAASQVVLMDELPSQALRGKKDSSMRVAINLVKSGQADACVSAGNTGALMATARFVLKTVQGIDRPAICALIPSQGGHTHMLDLGANADCTPQQLFQFGVMGSALASSVYHIESPHVGLLNIGEEEIKGIEKVRDAAKLFSASHLNYIGFVEGDDIFSKDVDVVVTDGFVGNVSLKTMEGLAKMISQFIREEFRRTTFTRLIALMALPVLRALKRRLDPRHYNGASLLGLKGVVVKSHGGSDSISYASAIRIAILEVQNQVPQRISRLLEQQFPQPATAE
ncbi:MAG: phosphate acyltransferase PlsX [Gammaproteobacteria bacterium]|nr:phosphate acyltransferase PlsX [Gammaproteobacteria bacterium]MDE2346673.1 phosphate acyltransferase PlsX [Gammaproteobacteria bacterium]